MYINLSLIVLSLRPLVNCTSLESFTNNTIYRTVGFVYPQWGCSSIYCSLSYPSRTLIICHSLKRKCNLRLQAVQRIYNAFISGVLRDKTMANILIYNFNDGKQITLFVDQYHWLKSFDTIRLEQNENSIKAPQVFKPKNKII